MNSATNRQTTATNRQPLSTPTFYLNGRMIDRDQIGDPELYLFSINGVWKADDDLTDEDIEALYYSGQPEVHLMSIDNDQ